ncbi:MAG TPA: YbdD/YjiX family protein [Gammaproteobacteria bacterium]|nr:YbdD/YjiX family protein [Gammaproteobacteria bacterium]
MIVRGAWVARARRRAAAAGRVLRTILGAPDYERYLRHVRECHPDREPLSRDEFVRQRMDDRYSRPGSRCC